MRLRRLLVIALAVSPWLFLTPAAFARDLTFEERVEAQQSIDRVYYAHQLGASRPFDQAVPRPMLEKKVRSYLRQTVALEKRWHVRVTEEMLRDELNRVTRDTRMPDRLREIFAALGDDPFVIQECLLRPVLVERMARERFATEVLQRPPDARKEPREWSEWWHANEHRFDERDAVAVATSDAALGLPDPDGAGPCLPDQTWDNGSMAEYRAGRTQHSAIWTGSLMVIWGGSNGGGTLGTGARYDPATDTWSPTSMVGAPGPRAGHAAIWSGTRMVVWGGWAGDGYFLASGGRYDPQSDTWTPVSQVNAPEGRSGASVVLAGDEMIVWGGSIGSPNGPTDLNTGRIYDVAYDVWSIATSQINAPAARNGHTAVWTGSRMLVWGGTGGGTALGSGGAYDPSTNTWSPLNGAGAPSPRTGHGAVWTGHFMVVWGGQSPSGSFPATGGRYDPGTDTWLPTATADAPSGRVNFGAVWIGWVMIVWGGGPSGEILDSGARYDPEADAWTPTSMINAPSARVSHTMVWTGNRLIVWGGDAFGTQYRSGGRYDPTTDSWTPTSDAGAPVADENQTAVWTGNEMIVWGGRILTDPTLNTGARYDPTLDSWRPVAFGPTPRSLHTAVWTGEVMIVWGGRSNVDGSPLNEGGRYDPITDVWEPTSSSGAPAPRDSQMGVWTGTRMIVWGGMAGSTYPATGGIYDPVADSWSAMSSTGAPSGRIGAAVAWTGARMIIWSGGDNRGMTGTGARYDPAADRWEPMSVAGAPTPRSNPSTVWTNTKMIIWGGAVSSVLNSGALYDPVADTWTPTSTTGAPAGRTFHTAVWTGTRMIVWGGVGGGSPPLPVLNTGGIYDPVGDRWEDTSLIGAPPGRANHTAIWTGRMMVIWGGDGAGARGTGGRFAYGMFADFDHDGYTVCDGDCDDSRPEAHPGAAEICNGLDDDCDGAVDNLPPAFCDDSNACTTDSCGGVLGCIHPLRDRDADGYGDALCGGNDCDDLDPLRHPGAPERCNGLDDNCNGVVDEGGDLLCDDHDTCTVVDVCRGLQGCFHQARDVDGDGYGDATCGGNDCDDMNPNVWFRAVEVASLSVSGGAPTALAWTDQGPLVGPEILYMLVSGTITSPGFSGFAGAACLQVDVATTSQESRPDPPVGTAYWYLSRAVNECATGTYGTPERDAGLISVCY